MKEVSRRHFLGLTAGAGAGWILGQPAFSEAAPPPGVTRPSAIALADAMRLGNACHAFDHLGAFGMQAEAAAACGATVIYASGVGGDGYEGLPETEEWLRRLEAARAYTEKAKSLGIPFVLGYLCATSIVRLDGFDKNWTPEFRAKFKSPPREWLQRDAGGEVLPSWYGGDYQPACMNHPDWRAYEKEMIRFQLETGHGGIFFDNPTVHPKGCYCDHCMARFREYLDHNIPRPARPTDPDCPPEDSDPGAAVVPNTAEVAVTTHGKIPSEPTELRALAQLQKDDFRRFRTTIARDFLAEMSIFARTIDPNALITANNSTNAPTVIYSQCNLYGYSPFEMSRAEDFVVIEDMSSQPRTMDDGKIIEYGPTYKQLKALCRQKPLVVCTIADADYHTPPNLMRLAMAEAAANQASYLLWPTWPEEHRTRLAAAARRQVDFLRQYSYTFEKVTPRAECSLFLPMRRWIETDSCRASELAAELSRSNIQYDVFTEEEFGLHTRDQSVVIESDSVLNETEARALAQHGAVVWRADANPNWLAYLLRGEPARAVNVQGAPSIRAYLFDTDDATYVHLLNLDVRKRSSFEDEVFPAKDFELHVRIILDDRPNIRSLMRARRITAEMYSADDNTTRGPLRCVPGKDNQYVSLKIPVLEVTAILAIKLG